MSKGTNIFTNIGRSIGALSEIIVGSADVVLTNLDSLEQLSIAGNIKSEDVSAGAQLKSDNFRSKLKMKHKVAAHKRQLEWEAFEKTGVMPVKKKKAGSGKRRVRVTFDDAI